MRRFKILSVIFLISFFLLSCASIRSGLIDLSESNLKNEATTIEVSSNLLKTFDCNYGFVKGALGPKFDEISKVNIDAMAKLQELSKKYSFWSDEHFDMCYSLGAEFLIFSETTKNVIKTFAPDLTKYLPTLINMVP